VVTWNKSFTDHHFAQLLLFSQLELLLRYDFTVTIRRCPAVNFGLFGSAMKGQE